MEDKVIRPDLTSDPYGSLVAVIGGITYTAEQYSGQGFRLESYYRDISSDGIRDSDAAAVTRVKSVYIVCAFRGWKDLTDAQIIGRFRTGIEKLGLGEK